MIDFIGCLTISSSAAKRKERKRLTMSPLQRGVRPHPLAVHQRWIYALEIRRVKPDFNDVRDDEDGSEHEKRTPPLPTTRGKEVVRHDEGPRDENQEIEIREGGTRAETHAIPAHEVCEEKTGPEPG